MGFLDLIFRRRIAATPDLSGKRQIAPLTLAWRNGATMPIPNWDAAKRDATSGDSVAVNEFWWRAALSWLAKLQSHLAGDYYVEYSENFVVLSSLSSKQFDLTVGFCERSRRRILRELDGVASSWGSGPHVVLIFDDIDAYYEYVGNYYPNKGVFAMSSGMFIAHGYGHFVFVKSDVSAMESVIAHELTHCLMAPLAIPAWVNEGTAVIMEKQLVPLAVDRRRGILVHREQALKRAEFWNTKTIQEFWSGKSFKRPDEGCSLSYELGEELTRLLAKNFEKYCSFMNSASRKDGGSEACQRTFGFTLGDLVSSVLGEGVWEPDPSVWHEGTERGQFALPD